MSALIIAKGVEKTWGGRWVLRGCDLTVSDGDRIGLIGANGCGKSTFLSILAGAEEADHGEVVRSGDIAFLAQDPDLAGQTVADALSEATAWHARLLDGYSAALDAGDVDGAAFIQDRLDDVGWTVAHRADAVCERLDVAPREQLLSNLSGGEGRRLALAIALLSDGRVLLLDEPTNHLDSDTVSWLESYLAGYRGAVVMVTHDRYLLEAVSNRMVEVEDGVTVVYDDCSYSDYLVARAERRARMEQTESRQLALLAREAEWASRSPAARSTKQKGRLKRLEELKALPRLSKVREFTFFALKSGRRGGSTAIEMHDVSKGFGGRTLFEDLTITIQPGDRVGIVGPNGAGKTTLLRMIRGMEQPDSGQLVRGARVKLGVLDQARSGLNDGETLFEAVGRGNDRVVIGDNTLHVASFLERFLFPRDMHQQKVAGLSGGERARLLLARLMLEGSNLLLLDEPTNDLDLLTLRILEEALLEFDGTVIVVTHDRAFLDRVCTAVLGLDGEGGAMVFADRLQFEAEQKAREARKQSEAATKATPSSRPTASSSMPKARLSYKESKELESLPDRIARAEGALAALNETLADPTTYEEGADHVAALGAEHQQLEGELESMMERWVELEERGGI